MIVYSQKISNWDLKIKSNVKWFFKITTITNYLKITSKIQEKDLLESLKGKIISSSSFKLSIVLHAARNIEKKKKPFFPGDKNDQRCTTALYIHSYILWFSYAFRVFSESLSEISQWLLLEHIKCLTLWQIIYKQ